MKYKYILYTINNKNNILDFNKHIYQLYTYKMTFIFLNLIKFRMERELSL